MNRKNASVVKESDDKACGGLWEIYVDEAQKYDVALIQSWKEDMDVILVFSGLYSAVLTAFVVESYQSLQVNQAETSTLLLKRISEQLASPGQNVTLTPIPNDDAFTATRAAFACNVLWFLSLALALGSAFLATVLQQMARRFLHRTSVVHSTIAQARLFQFLYFGIKAFGMHALVDIIPSFLHVSLGLFFAGLIAFLYDVNRTLSRLFVGLLVAAVALYGLLSILPVISLRSPYATPLSPLLWQIWRRSKNPLLSMKRFILRFVKTLYHLRQLPQHQENLRRAGEVDPEARRTVDEAPRRRLNPTGLSILEVTRKGSFVDAIMVASQKRNPKQDAACIVWAYRSLDEDREVLDFIEAIPDAILNGSDLRTSNSHLIVPFILYTDPQLDIMARTLALMQNAQQPWHPVEHRKRCAIACTRFLYAVARLLVPYRHGLVGVFGPGIREEQSPYISYFPADLLQILQDNPDYQDLTLANSAHALCALAICLSCRDSFDNFPFTGVPIGLVESLRDNLNLNNPRSGVSQLLPASMFENRDRIDNKDAFWCIKSIMSHFLCRYIDVSVTTLPPELATVCQLFIDNGAVPYIEHPQSHSYRSREWFNQLARANERLVKLNPWGTNMDTILGRLLDVAEDDRHSTGIYVFQLYILERVEKDGWGSTAKVWTPSRVLVMCRSLARNLKAIQLNSPEAVSLQELLLHAQFRCEEAVYSLLASVAFSCPISPLSFIVPLMCELVSEEISPHLNEASVEHLWDLESDTDFQDLKDEIPLVDGPWLVIIKCLNSLELDPPHIRDVLQYFHSLYLLDKCPHLHSCPIYYQKLVSQTMRFGHLWHVEPTMDLLHIVAMIWRIWYHVLFPSKDPAVIASSTQAMPANTKALLDESNLFLCPDGREVIRKVLKDASRRELHRIPSCSDFISRFPEDVEAIHNWILDWYPAAPPAVETAQLDDPGET